MVQELREKKVCNVVIKSILNGYETKIVLGMYKILLRCKDYENMIVPKKYGKIVLPLGKVNKT